MGRLFGTDGARGVAITELTCELAMQIGRAAALVLTRKMNHKPMIYIGKDTRIFWKLPWRQASALWEPMRSCWALCPRRLWRPLSGSMWRMPG